MPAPVATRRRILAIAVPALGALVAEPLFLLADSAIVGRLGVTDLAGLGIAGTVLSTVVSVFIFLAYGTTASVARMAGAGEDRGALALGVDAAWLAGVIGVVLAVSGFVWAEPLVEAFGADGPVTAAAVTYLRWSLPGIPAMLLVMSQVGVLRGLERTRVTLWVAAVGAVVNAVLILVLVHGVHLGIKGSAIGTSVTQLGMVVAVTWVVVRAALVREVPLRPVPARIRAAGVSGVPLFVRTVMLRAVFVAATAAATALGATELAAHQVALNVWNLLGLALDALAIAGQALTGAALGASDVPGTRAATRLMAWWGVGGGVVTGVVLLLVGGVLGPLFSPDPDVQAGLRSALLVATLAQPVVGYVCVLDGVLIGAGDGRFLAWASVLQTVAFVPVAWLIAAHGPGGAGGLALLWAAFAMGWMSLRAVILGLRARGSAWLVTGASRG